MPETSEDISTVVPRRDLPAAASVGGYAVTRLREAGGEETLRFEATITRHGRPIAHVANGGTGGCHRYEPLERGDRGHEDLAELDAWARLWTQGTELAGYADTDRLVDRLVEVATLNRMRRVVFVLDDEDYWRDGRAHAVAGIADRASAIEHIRRQYPNRNARVWNRNVSDWVPVD